MAKILLIDDSKLLLGHVKRMLISGGHEVVAISSGDTALQHLRDEPIDLVLTDLYMPEPDGFEIVQTVRGFARRIPVIVMSSNEAAYGVFRDGRALGATAAIQKPFTAEKLLATVSEVLAASRVSAQPAEANAGS